MKKPWYWLTAILIVSAMSCKGQSDPSESNTSAALKQSPVKETQAVPVVSNQEPVHITKAEFLKLVMDYEKNKDVWVFKGEKPCLVDFYADWCAPCKITSPILDDLAKKYAGRINIYKVDVDKEQELSAVFGVQSIPTFLFCPMEGNPTISSGIANSADATRNLFIQQIEEILLKEGNAPAI
jgi:thioredoxin